MDDPIEQADVESLDEVIDEIEQKLANLDERREDLERKIEVKRARVQEIDETIEDLDNLDGTLQEPPDS